MFCRILSKCFRKPYGLFVCSSARSITKTSDSKLPVLASSFPLTWANHPGYIAQIKKWRIRRSQNLSEMSSKGKDYRRISGLAKPLAECKTEVRFYLTHCVHYAWVTRVVNTPKNVLTKSGSRLFKTSLRNACTCSSYGLLLGTVPVYTHSSFSEHCSY